MHVLVVRHAQVHYGTDTFDSNPPLTALGRRQAAAIGDRLAGAGLTHVYTSSATRCLQTAACICAEARLPAVAAGWLQEWGCVWRDDPPSLEEVRRHCPHATEMDVPAGPEWACTHSESAEDEGTRDAALAERARAVAQLLLARHSTESADRICVVTHAGFGGHALLPALLGQRAPGLTFDLDNATLTEVRRPPGGNMIIRANDARHLTGLQATLCSNPACLSAPSPHWEDRACRLCGAPMLLKCPHCRVAAIGNPVPERCPECGQHYRAPR